MEKLAFYLNSLKLFIIKLLFSRYLWICSRACV